MSSIIRSGYAPSNTPDGKYFLQTDQACFAELKRGRTYICTAQEEAKVSHYVIITNADFTVTFNGDSDLVQVGRANNAIVMNVHRACRIDFTQGGNLEFKEGTAEFSSRITMGPNASGNVLVADSLPQQGDFAGQICSLTTGATYVWTGSEWSSTAGSSTLPTPTSTNKGTYLVSDGSSWGSSEQFTFVYKPADTVTNYRGTPRYMGVKLSSFTASTSIKQFSFDFCLGQHASASFNGHMKITVTRETADPTRSGVTLSVYAQPPHCVLSSSSQYGRVDGVDISKYFQFSVGLVGTSSSSETREIWLLVKCMNTDDGTGRVCRDPYMTILNCIGSYLGNATPSGNWAYINSTGWDTSYSTPYGQVFYNTSVPVSTAANQMLVSDGNGGWTTKTDFIKGYYGASSSKTTDYYTVYFLGSRTGASNQTLAQLSGYLTIGQHTHVSYGGGFKVTLYHGNDAVRQAKSRLVYAPFSPDVRFASGSDYDQVGNLDFNDDFELALYWKVVDTVSYFYLVIKSKLVSATGQITREANMTISNLVGDEDWTYPTSQAPVYTGATAPTEFGSQLGSTVIHQIAPIPMCTTADNGKVLKVVNGVPTWSAS